MVFHLQYVVDTIILVDATIDNLKTIKCILRGFELASGLRVNFSKSSLIEVNCDQTFLNLACEFLHYKKESLIFKYLGLQVDVNLCSTATCEPLVNLLYRGILSWKNMHVSLGERVILFNFVFNVIPIFFLYFLKLHVKVWKKIVKIHMTFLWERVKGESKIVWVKWEDVCKPKKLRGLSVRDLQLVNLALFDNGQPDILHIF